MNFTIIDSIDWANLKNAYGSAVSNPKHFRALLSNKEDDVDEAIYGFLHSEACHQYTTYSSTPYVVKCLLYIFEHNEFEEEQLEELLGFIFACTYSAKNIKSLRDEILAGQKHYEIYAKSTFKSGEVAKNLLVFCNKY